MAGTYLWSGSQFETLLPRPLLPVAQAPLISYVLRWIRAAGISSTTICANGSSRAIHEALDEGHFLPMRLDHHTDTMPRGPAGCLRDAGVPTDADTFVVAEGATIPAANLERVLCEHWRARAALTVVAHIETVTDAASKTHLSPAGVYVCDRRVLDFIAEAGFQDIKEHLIPQLYRAGERVDVHVCEPASQRVLDASSYVTVNQRAVENIVRQLVDAPRPYIRSGDLVAHPTADVHPNAVLVGPVLLGRSVRISDTATVVGPTTIGAETIVERHALVSRSVVWKRCTLGHHSVVDRCILSDDVVVDPECELFDLVKAQRRPRLGAVLDLFHRPERSMEPRTADVFSGSHLPSAPVSGPRPR